MIEGVAQWLLGNPHAADLGVEVEAVDETSARFSLRHDERHTMAGSLHGGAIASLVSVATRAIARTETPTRTFRSASMQVCYVRPARESLRAQTRLVRRTRDLAFFETTLEQGDGEVVAFASSVLAQGERTADDSSPTVEAGVRGRPDVPATTSSEVIGRAMAAIPFLSSRQVSVGQVAGGMAEVLIGPADVNLDYDGRMDEGALLAAMDAAGSTCPWTIVAPTSGAAGATVALTVQVLRPLPKEGLCARATLRGCDGRSYWSDVTITAVRSGEVHAFGTVQYRIRTKVP